MKKHLLLIVFLLATAGMSMAQDVYYTALHQNPDISYYWGAAVYKNGEMLYLVEDNSHSYAPQGLVLDPNTDDFYFAYGSDDDYYVVKNGTEVILHLSEEGTAISGIYWYDAPSGDPEDCLYAVGHKKISSDLFFHAAIWRGSDPTPLYLWDDNHVESEAYDLIVVEGASEPSVIYCGYYEHHAVVFRNDEILYTLSTESSEATEFELSEDGYITIGRETDPVTNNYVLKVWRNDSEYYSLTSPDVYGGPEALAISSGDIYVFGTDNGVRKIWKNGEVYYENSVDGYLMSQMEATTHLYFGYDGDVYKDEELLYDTEEGVGTVLCDLIVREACADPDVRELPYNEDFSFGTTDWECWTIEDEGNNTGMTYWYRNGANDAYYYWYGYDDCAVHRYGYDEQEGRLVSPALVLPASHYIKLEFTSFVGNLSDYDYSGVEISTVDDPTNFTEVWQLDPTFDPGDEWILYDVDLSDYAGQTVHVAFTYRGANAHVWAIDDINITCSPTSVNESNEEILTVSPNPASDNICIKGVEANAEVQIYNSLGMIVKSMRVSEDTKISIGDLAAGLYMIRCGDQTIRLVKE